MRTHGVRDFSFGLLRKTVLEWLTPGEGSPEFPWQVDNDDLGPLALPAGVVWFDGALRTLRFTYVPYELGTGLADDMNSEAGAFYAARFYQINVDALDAAPFVISHPLQRFPPQVQMVQRIVGITDTWRLYDIHGAGGTIDYDVDAEDIVIDPGAAFEGIVTVVG